MLVIKAPVNFAIIYKMLSVVVGGIISFNHIPPYLTLYCNSTGIAIGFLLSIMPGVR